MIKINFNDNNIEIKHPDAGGGMYYYYPIARICNHDSADLQSVPAK